jgi:exosome complex component RRP40
MTEQHIPLGQVIGPGDVIFPLPDSGQLRLGPGLTTQDGHVKSLKAGLLQQQTKSGQLWLAGKQKRYIPSEGDAIIGYIIERHAENFVVDINGPFSALLPQLSFEGATKRNRPNLKARDVVYARVATASRDMEPVLTCVDAAGRAGELGHLKEGALASVSCATARTLLSNPPPPVMEALGSSLQFEMAVGVNGRVWVEAPSPSTVVLILNVLQNSEKLTDVQAKVLANRMIALTGSTN